MVDFPVEMLYYIIMSSKTDLLRAIRQQCIECMGFKIIEIPLCTSPKCSLYPYRSGKDPMPNKSKSEAAKRRFHNKPVTEEV
jgi:hypothetical protein